MPRRTHWQARASLIGNGGIFRHSSRRWSDTAGTHLTRSRLKLRITPRKKCGNMRQSSLTGIRSSRVRSRLLVSVGDYVDVRQTPTNSWTVSKQARPS